MLQFSRFGSDTSEGLCHLAERALLSHDAVSDDFTWPTSDLIIRLYLLVSIRHQHRCGRTVPQDTEALNSPCIFKVLKSAHPNHFFRRSLQVCPQTRHSTFPLTRFQPSPEPQRCRFIVSKSQNISTPDWQTIDMSQAILQLR